MADKPKTYAQQVQELKDVLVQKDEKIEELLQKQSFIDEMQSEIAHLRALLEARDTSDQQHVSSGKAQLTDAIQRAESAEQGIRNLQKLNQDLINEKNALTQQLDILGAERDKNRGKDDKLTQLKEELQLSNFHVAKLNQRLRDLEVAKDTEISAANRAAREWKAVVEVRTKELNDLKSKLESFDLGKHLRL